MNTNITNSKNEKEVQKIFQVVSNNRKELPTPSKKLLVDHQALKL
jgi:hypothetical protein